MLISRRTCTAVSLIAATALAGCYASSPPPLRGGGPGPAPIVSTPTSVDGEWVSTDGVALSRFYGGRFETLATDTGNRLSEGSYSYIDQSTVTISVTSLIRQTTTDVNCALVTSAQLNCTSSAGQQFSLLRRQGVS